MFFAYLAEKIPGLPSKKSTSNPESSAKAHEFVLKEANKVYGELNDSQLSKLGSRGKAARELAPFLKKELGLI